MRFTGALFICSGYVFLLAAIGGALGGACRYLLSIGVARCCSAGFPSILAVNFGVFATGFVVGVGLVCEGQLAGNVLLGWFLWWFNHFSTFSLRL